MSLLVKCLVALGTCALAGLIGGLVWVLWTNVHKAVPSHDDPEAPPNP